MSAGALPVADAAALRRAGARVRRVRAILAVVALLVLAAAILLAARDPAAVPASAAGGKGLSTEIVLDVSGSVADSSSRTAGAALARLAHSGGRFGLILFSDSAQEALPPGTPAAELRPFARTFTPAPKPTAGSGPPFRPSGDDSNPWGPSFKGGTLISAGLAAARHALVRDHVHGTVLLISDLGDPPTDRRAVKGELIRFERAGIGVKILTLPNALRTDVRWFERVEGSAGLAHPLRAVHSPRPGEVPAAFPLGLAAAAGLLALVLGIDQLVGRSLRWGTGR